MPMTPLHFGLAVPLKVIRGDKFSVTGFIIANCMMDIEPVIKILFEVGAWGDHIHGITHTFMFATWLSLALCLRGSSRAWKEGVAWGAFTHVIVDGMVHTDVEPFFPLHGNPYYMDAMLPVSVVLYLLCAAGLAFFTGHGSTALQRGQARLVQIRSAIGGLWSKVLR